MRKAACWAVLLALVPAAAMASELVVEGTPCAKTVKVKAVDVPLQDVLLKLSSDLKFTLNLKAELKAPVSLDRTDTAENLIKDLLRGHNLVLDTRVRAACKDRETVATVWVLPAGEAAAPESKGLAWNPALEPRRHPRFGRRKNNLSNEEWKRLTEEWKAGRVVADPETGEPVPAPKKEGK